MNFFVTYALKKFWRTRSKMLLISLFLALGFWGWLMSETSQNTIRRSLEANARQVLSADITISVRREFSDEEQKIIAQESAGAAELTKSYELFAMMSTARESRLVLVRAIEDAYPFYGFVGLEEETQTSDLKSHKAWAYKEFKTLFDLKKGDQVRLGDASFQISNFVNEDQTQTFRLASLAPRIFIHRDTLKSTGLIQFGSTFTATYFLKTRPGTNVTTLTEKLKSRLTDPAIDVTSYLSLPDDQSSPTQRLSDFLGLTSLVALLFSALSLFYLKQLWSLEQQKERALLLSFGVTKSRLYGAEVLQSLLLALFSTGISTVLMLATSPTISNLLRSITGQDFKLDLGLQELGLVLACQFVLLLLLSQPVSSSKQVPLVQLIKNNFIVNQAGVLKFFPLFLVLWPYAILASRSVRNGTYFFLGLLFISLALVLIGRGLLRLLAQRNYESWRVGLALKSLNRQSTASWSYIFTVGLSAALLNLIPQIQSSLEGMLAMDQLKNRPSLFLFDIQDEQWPEIINLLTSEKVEPTAHSPLIRGRIIKLNQTAFERVENPTALRTREDEEQTRFRNRGVNVTYRSQLQKGETIVDGEPFSLIYDPEQSVPYISLERRYAGRIGAEVGDTLTFDIQGLEIQAQVKNLREVTWSRFEPNFFILFQDGVLNEAPKTHLASLAYLENDKKIQVMKRISNAFSNVSIIDVERLMNDLVRNLEKIGRALKLMTYLTLFTGLLTLIFLLTAESRRRAFEVHLLKVLGANSRSVLKSRLAEVVVVSFLSLAIGLLSSFVISYLLIERVFQIPVILDLRPALTIILSVVGLSTLVSWITTNGVFRENSFAFLKKEE